MSTLRLLASVLVATSVAGLAGPVAALPREAELARGAGHYVCKLARDRGRRVVAVFTFTNDEDRATSATKRTTTRVISVVGACGLRIVDRSKLDKVLEQQALSKTGLVDSDTAPETGKLIGADSLVFGSVDKVSIQVRIVDAATGEVLGVTVAEAPKSPKQGSNKSPAGEQKGGSADPRTKGQDVGRVVSSDVPGVLIREETKESVRRSFDRVQLKRWLQRLHRRNPALFVYVALTDTERTKLEGKRRGKIVLKAAAYEHGRLSAERKQQLESLRKRVQQLRAEEPRADRILHRHLRRAGRSVLRRAR